MRISDWSSDVCSYDLAGEGEAGEERESAREVHGDVLGSDVQAAGLRCSGGAVVAGEQALALRPECFEFVVGGVAGVTGLQGEVDRAQFDVHGGGRSEEHTSELQ